MAKRDTKPHFTPTPPSSARPTSSRRSARPGRKLLRVDSNPKTTSREEPHDRKASPNDIEPLSRQMSFSSYQVLPPILYSDGKENNAIKIKDNHLDETKLNQNDELMADKAIAKQQVPTEEAIASGEVNKPDAQKSQGFYNSDQNQYTSSVLEEQMVPQGRKLYRKGDIFRDAGISDVSLKNISEDETTDFTDKGSHFKIPSEPDENSIKRIHLAFRVPNKSRIDRYFLPSDRIGDVIAFLQQVIFDHHEKKCILELFITDFPRRKLDQLSSTLADANIKDRTVMDVSICDEGDIS